MIPYVNRQQIAKLDELMVGYFKIPVVMMMENAGYRMAEFVRLVFGAKKKKILICCGKGNNGGDGIAAARHLLNFGYKPRIFLVSRDLVGEPGMHLKIARILKIPIIKFEQLKQELKKTDLVYDCLIGYNLSGAPRGKFSEVIEMINASGKTVIACDVPSGIDTDKGIVYSQYVKASHILFLSLPKKGCRGLRNKKYVADIGVPKALYPKIKVKAENYFQKEEIVKI